MTFFRNRAFPALAGVLWAVFLFLDVTRTADSTLVKFAGICLCCIAALPGAHTADGRLVAAALCFTVGADWFLLVRDKNYTLGVCLFLVVQGLYAVRLYALRDARPCLPGLVFRAGELLLLAILTVTDPSLLPLWAVLLYFSNLCVNTLEAFALKKRVFAWGLLLFVCCDICVGLWNVSPFIPPVLGELARIGMWFFYLPSQVLIVLSQEQEKGCPHEKTV